MTMIEEAELQIEFLQGGVITLGMAALGVLGIYVLFVIAKRMLAESDGRTKAERDAGSERFHREREQWDRYRRGYTYHPGPKGPLP